MAPFSIALACVVFTSGAWSTRRRWAGEDAFRGDSKTISKAADRRAWLAMFLYSQSPVSLNRHHRYGRHPAVSRSARLSMGDADRADEDAGDAETENQVESWYDRGFRLESQDVANKNDSVQEVQSGYDSGLRLKNQDVEKNDNSAREVRAFQPPPPEGFVWSDVVTGEENEDSALRWLPSGVAPLTSPSRGLPEPVAEHEDEILWMVEQEPPSALEIARGTSNRRETTQDDTRKKLIENQIKAAMARKKEIAKMRKEEREAEGIKRRRQEREAKKEAAAKTEDEEEEGGKQQQSDAYSQFGAISITPSAEESDDQAPFGKQEDEKDEDKGDFHHDELQVAIKRQKYLAAKQELAEQRKGETPRDLLERQLRDPYIRKYIDALNGFVWVLVKQERFAEAEPLSLEAFELAKAFLYGRGDYTWTAAVTNFAGLIPHRKSMLNLTRFVYGDDHETTKESERALESMVKSIGNFSVPK